MEERVPYADEQQLQHMHPVKLSKFRVNRERHLNMLANFTGCRQAQRPAAPDSNAQRRPSSLVSRHIRWLALAFLAGLVDSAAAVQTTQLEQVRLQLKWPHQFQFAGYYAAIEQGYYRDAGLAVTLIEPATGEQPVDAVIHGEAEYGVGTSDLLLWRNRGAPVVVLAVIFQHSPLAIGARRDAGIDNLHELAGKRVMVEPHAAELLAMFRREGLSGEQLQLLPHSFNTADLLDEQVDAMSVYTTDETYELNAAGLDYVLFEPASTGIDFYGDNLYTTEAELARHPERAAAFLAASLRGWAYAMSHVEATVDLILERYSQRHDRAHLLFEARAMRRLIQPDLIEPGYMHAGRWQHIADTYAGFGMLPVDMRLADFLYDPNPDIDLSWLYWTALSGFLLAGFAGSIGLYIQRLRRRAEIAAARYRAVYEAAPLAFVVFDAERRVLDWNHHAEIMFGWRREEVLGRDLHEFLLPDNAKWKVEEAIRDTLETGHPVQNRNWNLTRTGGKLLCEWVNATIHDPDDKADRVLALGLDITERVRLEEQLERNAHFDALTGLANRTLFMQRLHQAVAQDENTNQGFALLFLDLDGFKTVNDSHGHPCGDELLKFIGQRLSGITGANDTVGRLGGDEFALLLPDADSAEAAFLAAEHYLQAFDEPLLLCGARHRLGASIGIALAPEHGRSADELLASADRAMYRAKRDGGGRHALADIPTTCIPKS